MWSQSRTRCCLVSLCVLLYTLLSCGVQARQLHAIQLPIEWGSPESVPEESVPDNRTLVTDTTSFPYNAVGIIQIFDKSGEVLGLCSGALIGPNIVLTAAHCLLDPDTDTPTQTATFTPGYNPQASVQAPYGIASMQNWEIPQAFASCVKKDIGDYSECDQRVDIGVMMLNSTFDQYMDFGYNGYNSNNTGGQVVNTAGYPGDEGACANFQTTGDDSGCAMYFTSCTDAAITPGMAYDSFPCYGYEGQSGSPIWLYNVTTGNSTITGVLTSGDAEDGEAFTIVTQQVYSELQGYIKQMTSSASSQPVTA